MLARLTDGEDTSKGYRSNGGVFLTIRAESGKLNEEVQAAADEEDRGGSTHFKATLKVSPSGMGHMVSIQYFVKLH